MICGNYLWLAAPFLLTRQTLTNHCVGLNPPTITMIVWERRKKKKIPFCFFFAPFLNLARNNRIWLIYLLGWTVTSLYEKLSNYTKKAARVLFTVSSKSSGTLAIMLLAEDGFLSLFKRCLSPELLHFYAGPVLSWHRVIWRCTGRILQRLQWCDGHLGIIQLKGTSHMSCSNMSR